VPPTSSATASAIAQTKKKKKKNAAGTLHHQYGIDVGLALELGIVLETSMSSSSCANNQSMQFINLILLAFLSLALWSLAVSSLMCACSLICLTFPNFSHLGLIVEVAGFTMAKASRNENSSWALIVWYRQE
jgi:hypothetical protein